MQRIATGRRLALVTTALLSAALLLASCSSGGSSSPSTTASGAGSTADAFAFPAAAVVRPLGEIPKGTCNPQGSQVCNGEAPGGNDIEKGGYPLSVPGLGVPVGGVGAGSFMVNQAGTFGPWDFGGSQDSTWEMRILPQAAFHFREQVGSSPATVKTLATKGPTNVGTGGTVAQRSWGSPLSSWNLLSPGQGSYAALYPFGYMHYTPFQTHVAMKFYSPIVARQDRSTSLPVVYFQLQLSNPTGKTDAVSTMFTMPNAPDHVGTTPASVRTGFADTYEQDKATGVSAVTMSADSPSNTPDAQNSSWTIAAKPIAGQHVTYTTSWNADGNGSDVYAPFTSSGNLPDKPLDTSNSAGAIDVSATLKPGQTTTVSFALSWDFPQVGYSNNQTIWMRRYTDFYGAKETAQNSYVPGSYPGHQSFKIADDALTSQAATLSAVDRWWSPIATNPSYPSVLRTAALNQLSQLVFSDSFWEGGLVSNTVAPTGGVRLGTLVPGTHLFDNVSSNAGLTGNPSSGLNNANELDVDSYGYLAYNLLFPSLERDRLRAVAEAVMVDPSGNPGKDVFSVSGDPFVKWTEGTPPDPGSSAFIDIPSKVIYRLYAYATLNHDQAFLRATYPAMRKSLTYLQGLIKPGASLPSSPALQANTYDIIPTNGLDVYDSELYLLSLEAVIKANETLGGSSSDRATLVSDLAKAKASFEATFWDQQHGYYRYTLGPTPSQDSVLLDTFFAQHIAERLGLPDLVNLSHYKTQLTNYYDKFVFRKDAQGQLLGGANMALPTGETSYPLVGPLGLNQEEDVWTGTNFFEAATYVAAGKRFGSTTLKNDGLQMAEATASQIWLDDANGYVFDPPEAWNQSTTSLYTYPAYVRATSVWDLLDTLQPLSTSS
jgi:uncharacterized protein (DUF608 family)